MTDRILFRENLILPGCQNRLDILERGAGCILQRPLAGILQPLRSVFICQLQQTHAGLITLLFYLVAAENGTNHNLRIASYLPGPVDKSFSVPLDILLVVGRHMLLNRAVLVESPVQPGVGADPVSTVEDLHRGSGEPYIHLLLNVFKGNGIVHALHRDVVVGTYRCYLPGCQFKWSGR